MFLVLDVVGVGGVYVTFNVYGILFRVSETQTDEIIFPFIFASNLT